VSLASTASLAVALLQLDEVQLLTKAMNAADLGAAASAADSARIDSFPRVEARRDAFYERENAECRNLRSCCYERPAVTRSPIFTNIVQPLTKGPTLDAPTEPQAEATQTPPVFQPPWDTLPWPVKTPPTPLVKIVIQRPDIPQKGLLIDLFF